MRNLEVDHVKDATGEPLRAGEAGASAPVLLALPADGSAVPERCSCDEAINLRERLAIAARGTLAIHVVKESGYWTVELWRDGELKGIDGGVLTVAEAMDRASGFIRRELPVNLTRNGAGT